MGTPIGPGREFDAGDSASALSPAVAIVNESLACHYFGIGSVGAPGAARLGCTMLFGLIATDPAAFGIDAAMLASAALRYD